MKKEKIILIGGGGHCKSCIDVIEHEDKFEIAGIIDIAEKIGQKVLGYKIIGTDKDLPKLAKQFKFFFITIGQISTVTPRINVYNRIKKLNVILPVIISPDAYVSKHAHINNGTIIMHNAIVNADAKIGFNCIINNNALIEHDAVIGDFCHISTGAIVNGCVVVGNQTFFGSGSVSKQYINIPKKSFIKAHNLVKGK